MVPDMQPVSYFLQDGTNSLHMSRFGAEILELIGFRWNNRRDSINPKPTHKQRYRHPAVHKLLISRLRLDKNRYVNP